MREDVQNRVGKEWPQMQVECLWEDREECRRLCHKMAHPGKNMKADCGQGKNIGGRGFSMA